MKNIVVAAKLRKGEWRAALIVDNEFQDSFSGTILSDIIEAAIDPFLIDAEDNLLDGSSVSVNVVIQPKTEPK